MPVFFEMGSVSQLTYGLVVCFLSFGAYMLFRPYVSDSDDRLAQLCQMQIFFSLVSSILIRHARQLSAQEGVEYNSNLDLLLCTLTFLPLAFALAVHVLEEELYAYLDEMWVQPTRRRLQHLQPFLWRLRSWATAWAGVVARAWGATGGRKGREKVAPAVVPPPAVVQSIQPDASDSRQHGSGGGVSLEL